jgi:amidase
VADFGTYLDYDAVGLAGLIDEGQVTPSEVVDAAIEQVEAHNQKLNAVVRTQFDKAREKARAPQVEGPFSGVPLLVKDLNLIKGEQSALGSVFFRDFVSPVTSEYMQRTLDAGFVSIGRTNTPEFGLLPTTEAPVYGAAKNPWNLDYSTGGSSGGSGAAVAARMVPLATASDGGGSIRIPASACGVFGLKPSRGRNPRFPIGAADYLTTDLALSISVRDSAHFLDAIHGALPGAVYSAPRPSGTFAAAAERDPKRLKIGFSTVDFFGKRVHSDCADAVTKTAALLQELGHEVEEADMAIDGLSMADAFTHVWGVLAGGIFELILTEADKTKARRLLRATLGDVRAMRMIAKMESRKAEKPAFEKFTVDLIERSMRKPTPSYILAKNALGSAARVAGEYLQRYDVALSPVLGRPPLPLGAIDQTQEWEALLEELVEYVAFTPLANFGGMPAMSVPLHWNDAGLPIGSHFMASQFEEETLLSLAGQLERASPWRDKVPPVGR